MIITLPAPLIQANFGEFLGAMVNHAGSIPAGASPAIEQAPPSTETMTQPIFDTATQQYYNPTTGQHYDQATGQWYTRVPVAPLGPPAPPPPPPAADDLAALDDESGLGNDASQQRLPNFDFREIHTPGAAPVPRDATYDIKISRFTTFETDDRDKYILLESTS